MYAQVANAMCAASMADAMHVIGFAATGQMVSSVMAYAEGSGKQYLRLFG